MGRQRVPLDEKQCPGCRQSNPTKYSWCHKCAAAYAASRNNGYAQYNEVDKKERREIIKFVDEIVRRRGFCTMADISNIIEYYQVTHKLIYKYNEYTTARQIWNFWLDLMIWCHKQKGKKVAFNEMRREDAYKILMRDYAN